MIKTDLKLTVAKSGSRVLTGVGFGLGKLADHISPMSTLALIGELSINQWNNFRKPQIFIQDVTVKHWQLFDYRGGSRFKQLQEMVPKDNLKWILFTKKDAYEKFSARGHHETIFGEFG